MTLTSMTPEQYAFEYEYLIQERNEAIKSGNSAKAKRYRQAISKLYEDHGKALKEGSEPAQADADLGTLSERMATLEAALIELTATVQRLTEDLSR